jgi:hypothetical protein
LEDSEPAPEELAGERQEVDSEDLEPAPAPEEPEELEVAAAVAAHPWPCCTCPRARRAGWTT